MDLSKREELLAREVRQWKIGDVQVRADEAGASIGFHGIASVTENAYEVHDAFGAFEETVDQGAFARTLGRKPDVVFLTNHGGLSLARTTAGTLRLRAPDGDLEVDADFDGRRTDARDLAHAIERRDVDEMSFAFRVVRQEWNEDYTERRILEIDLNRGDVSAVNFGANPATSAALRALGPGFEELDDAVRAIRAGDGTDTHYELAERAHRALAQLVEARTVKVPASIERDLWLLEQSRPTAA